MYRRDFVVTTGTVLLAGCAGSESDKSSIQTPTPTPTFGVRETWPSRGVSISPRSYENKDFTAFFELVQSADLDLRWAGAWTDLTNKNGGGAAVAQLADQYGYNPIIETGVYSVSQDTLFRPLDETEDEFISTVREFAATHEPPYFGLGVEVNLHADRHPDEFDTYVSLYQEAYDAIKNVSPNTFVYTGFQLEWLRGLRGGVFGGTNDPDQAQWDILDQVPSLDLMTFTSFPHLIYETPAGIPDDYYTTVADRVDQPIALTELGWPHQPNALGWSRSEAQQVEYVNRLLTLTSDVDVALLVWVLMYDQGEDLPGFEGMDLRRSDGSTRPVWDEWAA